MPAELTTEGKDLALRALFATPGLLIGLTLESGDEVDDANYKRQPIVFGRARTLDGTLGRVMVSTSELTFGGWAKPSSGLITGYIIVDAEGTVLAKGDLIANQYPQVGDRLFWAPGSLPVGIRDGV